MVLNVGAGAQVPVGFVEDGVELTAKKSKKQLMGNFLVAHQEAYCHAAGSSTPATLIAPRLVDRMVLHPPDAPSAAAQASLATPDVQAPSPSPSAHADADVHTAALQLTPPPSRHRHTIAPTPHASTARHHLFLGFRV